jgi:hypothetical protein
MTEPMRAALAKALVLYAPTVRARVWAAIAALPAGSDDEDAWQAALPLMNAAGAEQRAAEARFENEDAWAAVSRVKH